MKLGVPETIRSGKEIRIPLDRNSKRPQRTYPFYASKISQKLHRWDFFLKVVGTSGTNPEPWERQAFGPNDKTHHQFRHAEVVKNKDA